MARPVPVGDAGPAAGRQLREHDAWRRPDRAELRHQGDRLAGLSAALFAEPNPVVIKAVLHAQGRIPSPDVRLPLLAASPGSARHALTEADALAA